MWAVQHIDIELIILFFSIAILYSTVGFGGGSSYLAILSLFAWPFELMRLTALSCNILVVIYNFAFFTRYHHIPWKRILPIVVCSIPFAYIGGRTPIEEQLYFILLGFSLFIAGLLMIIGRYSHKKAILPVWILIIIGSAIGYLSGIVGIGGGIFLAPVLYFSRWGTEREIAICASLYILLNSVSGIIGQLSQYDISTDVWSISVLVLTVLIGSLVGNFLSHNYFRRNQLRYATGVLIIIVGIRILLQHF